MTPIELDRLQKLTAITLSEEEVPLFLDYFTQMKEMFDGFVAEFWEQKIWENLHSLESVKSFVTTKFTDPEPILANVSAERLQDHAIVIDAVF